MRSRDRWTIAAFREPGRSLRLQTALDHYYQRTPTRSALDSCRRPGRPMPRSLSSTKARNHLMFESAYQRLFALYRITTWLLRRADQQAELGVGLFYATNPVLSALPVEQHWWNTDDGRPAPRSAYNTQHPPHAQETTGAVHSAVTLGSARPDYMIVPRAGGPSVRTRVRSRRRDVPQRQRRPRVGCPLQT